LGGNSTGIANFGGLVLLRKLLLIALLLLNASLSYSEILSCDGNSRIEPRAHGSAIIVSKAKQLTVKSLGHEVTGGGFSGDGAYAALYGSPLKIDLRSPQATILTIYKIKDSPKKLITASYGSGIYSAKFSKDSKFIVIDTASGLDIINIESGKHDFHDVGYESDIPLFECDSAKEN
jgi:hypothetical protein